MQNSLNFATFVFKSRFCAFLVATKPYTNRCAQFRNENKPTQISIMDIKNEKIKKISKALPKILENDLSRNIIKPLFEKLGYHKVEYYGGTDEEGKDLLFWEKDKLGEIKLSVAQVKHFKFTNTASGKNSFQTIVNQLIASSQKSVHFSDASLHIPYEIFLISSFQIDSKSIKSRFAAFPPLNNHNIRIIDGLKLAELLYENWSEKASELINEDIDFSHYSSKTLNNNILLKALGFHNEISIKSIYTDIDFSLGKSSTKIFFNKKFKGINKQFKLNKNEWYNLKTSVLSLEKKIQKLILKNEVNFIEDEYSLLESQLKKWEKEHKILQKKKKNNIENLSKANEKLKIEISRYNRLLAEQEKLLKIDKSKAISLNKDINRYKRQLSPITELEKKDKELINSINEHQDVKPELYYFVEINGIKISNWLNKKKNEIKDKLSVYNLHTPSTNELKSFILECHQIFNLSSKITTIPECLSTLNISKKEIRTNYESNRFKLSINKVFDTGVNLTILGEAGAGKTTSLQMYALENINSKEKIIIWSPLSNVIQNWSFKKNSSNTKDKIENLDIAISEYLRYNGVNITDSDFKNLLESDNKVMILFDGLDESIRSNEWLPKSINNLSKKYKNNVQIIVTSRMFGSYIDELNFFTVTLLPFTVRQRNQFIDKWFDNQDKKITDRIKKHLSNNKSINEITRNPLLTTTLCVLAKHDLPLPQTEIKLYYDRLRLLTGYYDSVKNINRITTTPQNLEILSRKLAFNLHKRNTREKDYNLLRVLSVELMNNILDEQSAQKAFDELINPCNILVPMSDNGDFGFGHLRYQEHLSALEINSNRSINVIQLLKYQWWKETIQLFVQMSDDIEWLINEVGHYVQKKSYSELMTELIKLRPKNEILFLLEKMNLYKKEASLDSVLDITDDLYINGLDDYIY